jgi:predicted dienelactone hydrolase
MLIFEPGLCNIPTQFTALLEDLASHGYVIFAITPTYSSDVVVFPDERVATAKPAGSLEDVADLQAAGNRLVTVWAQDVIFVMNRLEQLDATPGTMWSQRLDLARLGVFGHSFGGATVAQVCHMDARCKAGIDIDGDLFGNVVQTGLEKPFMVIQSDKGSCSDSDCRMFQQETHAILSTVPQGERYSISISGMKHFNFTDYAVTFSPLRAFGLLGSIDGARGLEITRVYVAAFFDTYLNKLSSPLLSCYYVLMFAGVAVLANAVQQCLVLFERSTIHSGETHILLRRTSQE